MKFFMESIISCLFLVHLSFISFGNAAIDDVETQDDPVVMIEPSRSLFLSQETRSLDTEKLEASSEPCEVINPILQQSPTSAPSLSSRCLEAVKSVFSSAKAQFSTGLLIQTLADGYLISSLMAQSQHLADAHFEIEVEKMNQTCGNELTQFEYESFDSLNCQTLSELGKTIQAYYRTSGAGYHWGLYTVAAIVLAMGNSALPQFLTFDLSNIPVFSILAMARTIAHPLPTEFPTSLSQIDLIPESVLKQLTLLISDHKDVFLSATLATGVRTWRVMNQYFVKKQTRHHQD